MFGQSRFGIEEWGGGSLYEINVDDTPIGYCYSLAINATTYDLFIAITKDAVDGIDSIPLPNNEDYVFKQSSIGTGYRDFCEFYNAVKDSMPAGNKVGSTIREVYTAEDLSKC